LYTSTNVIIEEVYWSHLVGQAGGLSVG